MCVAAVRGKVGGRRIDAGGLSLVIGRRVRGRVIADSGSKSPRTVAQTAGLAADGGGIEWIGGGAANAVASVVCRARSDLIIPVFLQLDCRYRPGGNHASDVRHDS